MALSTGKNGMAILWALFAGGLLGLVAYFIANGFLGGELQQLLTTPLQIFASIVTPAGTLFVRLLKMVMVPLVLTSIFMAIVNLGSPQAFGSMGKKAFSYYFTTTAVAVLIGLIFVNIFQPGIGADLGNAGLSEVKDTISKEISQQKGLLTTIIDVLINAIPTNPIQALATSNILQIICATIVFALVALYIPNDAQPVIAVIRSAETLTLKVTQGIMKLAPICIFSLVYTIMAKSGLQAIETLSGYMLTVIIGLGSHGVLLVLVGSAMMKKSPLMILKGISPALLTAFSTASSAASLPITMANVNENFGVKENTAKFVLPLGATVNMDGTALYESVAAIFIANAYGIDLTITQQIIIFMTASLAAVGAAAIPGAGLITMGLVLTAVGLPLEGIGLILAVDRILDMFRTTINVLGDSVGCLFVEFSADKCN